ncbi:HNH endonuclease [Pseudomonas sp. GCEP-101]|uniref:HNH endonuclease n=1 Tax=Pseudomonas sp. GCEP-101 TaxID=2974552 RepID=UPI00223B8203|nr:HNH endonuclease [Pseudomonas sp. GCEP-101]
MSRNVTRISAVGSRKDSLGKLFVARPDRSGRYVLNRKKGAATSHTSTNLAVNKVYVTSLEEAVKLLHTGDYLINLVAQGGQRALRSLEAVQIDYTTSPHTTVEHDQISTAEEPKVSPAKSPNWQKVFNTHCQLGVPSSRREILAALVMSNPQFKESNLDADLRLITVNDFARGHHQGHEPPRRTDQKHRYDLLFKRHCPVRGAILFERYDPAVHGVWELYRDDTVLTKSKMRTRAYATGVLQRELDRVEKLADQAGDFDFINEPDARDRISRAIVLRRGQTAFRQALIEAYRGTCAITGCTAVDVLEAAHIVPYKGEHTNRVDNGLLLRADIHSLFDLGFLWIELGVVKLAAHLLGTEYGELSGRRLRLPLRTYDQPSGKALELHAQMARASVGLA